MQVFMQGVSYGATYVDVQLALADILHRPPFPTDPPTNFHVQLFDRQGRQGHTGSGLLTFPTRELGQLFLNTYGRTSITVKGRRILFSPNNRPSNTALIQSILATPWEDPQILQERRRQMKEQSAPIALASFSFGRFCRDGAFSSELDYPDMADIACDLERRQVRLTFHPSTGEETSQDGLFNFAGLMSFLTSSSKSAWFTPYQVIALVTSAPDVGPFHVFFELETPPIFEVLNTSTFLDRDPLPQRLASFTDHGAMPPICRHLCLAFKARNKLEAFLERCKALHLPRPRKINVSVVRRHIYSTQNLAQANRLVVSLEFRLAFEAEKALASSVLDPLELISLQGALASLWADFGLQAAEAFRYFTTVLQAPSLCKRPSAHKRGGTRMQRQTSSTLPSLSQLLDESVAIYRAELHRPKPLLSSSAAIFQSYHLIMTPATRILEGPLPDQSNSVLRRFGHHDNFLRVSFQDENRSKLRGDFQFAIDQLLTSRFRYALVNGIRVAGRVFTFLGYSMSGLKEGAVWFMTPFQCEDGSILDANGIRNKLGDFSHLAYRPARLGARWAQTFSASDPSLSLEASQIRSISDIKSRTGSVFTDGSGVISPELSREVWKRLPKSQRSSAAKAVPSCFQIRLGGAKGIVVQDPRLTGKVICLRPSQTKFEAPDVRTLDIAATSSRPSPMFLNKPLIVLMEHLGVDKSYLVTLQERAIQDVEAIRESFSAAFKLFSDHGLGASFRLPSLFKNLVKELDLDVASETCYDGLCHELIGTCLSFACTHVLREIKYRAHIPVPGSFTLIGAPDEWACLREGEIYATVHDERMGLYQAIEGDVLITRSPQIHPGDLQRVKAVRRPELKHLTNVVVFSCEGERSLPSCLGGGDVDGDTYNLILDPNLLPAFTSEPGSYIGLDEKTTKDPCTVKDVADFVIDYMKSDLVGIISILHLRFADVKGADCQECLDLAKYASWAVDFPKTGTSVDFRLLPRPPSREKPDFLSYEGSNVGAGTPYYPSDKILGQLFRRVPMEQWLPLQRDDISPSDGHKIEKALRVINLEQLGLPPLAVPEDILMEEMRHLLDTYSEQLFTIARAHTVSKNANDYLSEGELVSGSIQAKWADHRRRRDAVTAMNLQTHELAKAIRQEFRRVEPLDVDNQHEGDEDDEDDFEDEGTSFKEIETFRRAWAAWRVAEEALQDDRDAFGPQSFGLLALGTLLEAVKEAER